jgi:ankyrin repeat protein
VEAAAAAAVAQRFPLAAVQAVEGFFPKGGRVIHCPASLDAPRWHDQGKSGTLPGGTRPMEKSMKPARLTLLIAGLAASLASVAAAQSKPDSETLLEAIDEQRSNDVVDMVTRKGAGIINTRGYSGVTPLTVAMRKRSSQYVNYLLQQGADPNFGEKNGDTALIVAARLGYMEGVLTMLAHRATVDAANRQGETALIVATQNRQVQVVRRLLEAGASPTRTDNASGLSARDYAARDRRSTEMLKLMDSVKPKPVFVAGPVIK